MRKFFSILICISCLVCLSCGSSTNGGEVQNKTCTITFHANNGTGITKKQTTGANVYFNLEENTFTYSEHSFDGWNTSENGSGKAYSDKEKTITNTNLNLYAQWKDDNIQKVYTAEELINALRHNSFVVNNDSSNILSFDFEIEFDFCSVETKGTFSVNSNKIVLNRLSGGTVEVSVSGTPNEITLTVPVCDGEQALFMNSLTKYQIDFYENKEHQIVLKKTLSMNELHNIVLGLNGTYIINGDSSKTITFENSAITGNSGYWIPTYRDAEEYYVYSTSDQFNCIYLQSSLISGGTISSATYYLSLIDGEIEIFSNHYDDNERVKNRDKASYPPSPSRLTKIN